MCIRDRYSLDGDAAARTVDTTHGVKKKDRNSPQRHELKLSLGERVVTRSLAATATAHWPRSSVGANRDENRFAIFVPLEGVIDKSLLLFNVIEDSFKLHLVRWGVVDDLDTNINTRFTDKMHFPNTTIDEPLSRRRHIGLRQQMRPM